VSRAQTEAHAAPHSATHPDAARWRLSVKAEQVSTFLGKKITPQVAAEIGSRLSTRIEGTCIKHRLGSCSVKPYDKFARILRIETTTNDVSFFKHHRNDQALLRAVHRPEFNIHGLARCDLLRLLPALLPSTLSRQLRRLRVLGLLKRAANTYRYYLTRSGRLVIAACERLSTFTIVPALACV
jgi:hypothetical protein